MWRRLFPTVLAAAAVAALAWSLAPREVSFSAVGDILLARGVARVMEEKGVDYPLGGVAGALRADLVFANLEGPLSGRGFPAPKHYTFRAAPRAVDALRAGGVNVVSLANNHALDYGREALLDTVDRLRQAGIPAVGAGRNAAEAARPVFVERRGVRVAFLAFTTLPPEGMVYDPARPEVALARSPETVAAAVRAAAGQAHVVIVSFHWGEEFARQPTALQRSLAHAAVDAGASLVLGHHPHVLQPVEEYRGATIAYSLGNFVFDQHRPDTLPSAILRARLTRRGVREVTFLPARSGERPELLPASKPAGGGQY